MTGPLNVFSDEDAAAQLSYFAPSRPLVTYL